MGIVMGGVPYVLAQEASPEGAVELICLAISLLIAAAFLRAVAIWVPFLNVPFDEVCFAVLTSWLIVVGVVFLLVLMGLAMMAEQILVSVYFPIVILVQTIWFFRRLSVTFVKALMISLVITALTIGVFVFTVLIYPRIWQAIS